MTTTFDFDNDMNDMSDFLKDAKFTLDDGNDSSDNDELSLDDWPSETTTATTTPPTGQESKKNSYLKRLYAMLEDCSPTVATWTKEGTAFVIVDPKALEATYLPLYFKAIKFASFYRQLNSYRFHKVKIATALEFSHPDFVRGQPEKLTLITRRRRVQKLNVHAIDSMTDGEVRATLADVVSYIRTLHAELEETKATVETLLATMHKS
ncbi:hypothetical protein LEN26_004376 [Aphanomyces euteiches]|nr:hypothetical protein AeMF1_007921 [Aphanomyces euteiches]KAH9148900.1 hypothetical protein LEN26_004376 [Aphanomyces euteiches]KAH9168775.1 hypothetical protein AeNC1_017855 [Aphanomyces euteiches]